jgi:hypothetical protein
VEFHFYTDVNGTKDNFYSMPDKWYLLLVIQLMVDKDAVSCAERESGVS